MLFEMMGGIVPDRLLPLASRTCKHMGSCQQSCLVLA